MSDNGTAAWAETVFWIQNASPLELIWRFACIPLVPCAVIILINELAKLIGG